jgi:hypothetical protein
VRKKGQGKLNSSSLSLHPHLQAILSEKEGAEKAQLKLSGEMRELEDHTLEVLGEQTTADRSAGKTAAETRELRKRTQQEEVLVAEAQNELAKLQVSAC